MKLFQNKSGLSMAKNTAELFLKIKKKVSKAFIITIISG